MVFYNRRFNAYDAGRVVKDMTELAARYRLSEIALIDSNFLVDIRQAVAIARGIHDSGILFKWTFQASANLLCQMTDDEVRRLGKSGVCHIGFGTESASPDVLHYMNKPHQSIPDMYEAAAKCARAGIRVTFNLIFGFPGEEERHREETLRVVGDIARRFDNVSFSANPSLRIRASRSGPNSNRRACESRTRWLIGRELISEQTICPGWVVHRSGGWRRAFDIFFSIKASTTRGVIHDPG
jgi:radical SAM family protein